MAPHTEICVSFGREFFLLMLILLKVINHLTMLEEKLTSAWLDKYCEMAKNKLPKLQKF